MGHTQNSNIGRREFLLSLSAMGAGFALAHCTATHTPSTQPQTREILFPGVAFNHAPQSFDITQVILRRNWAEHPADESRMTSMNGVALLTFHHSGPSRPLTDESYAATLAFVRAMHQHYVGSAAGDLGWPDLGFHFLIDRAGRVWQARSLAFTGEHVRYNNDHNIGICVLGDFNSQELTSSQSQSIITFTRLLRRLYNLPISRIKTHQEIVATECPGAHLQPFLNGERRNGTM